MNTEHKSPGWPLFIPSVSEKAPTGSAYEQVNDIDNNLGNDALPTELDLFPLEVIQEQSPTVQGRLQADALFSSATNYEALVQTQSRFEFNSSFSGKILIMSVPSPTISVQPLTCPHSPTRIFLWSTE